MDDLDSLLSELGINNSPQEEQQSAPQSNEGVNIESEPTEEQAPAILEGTEAIEAINEALSDWAQTIVEHGHGLMEQVNTINPITIDNMDLDIGVIHDPFYDENATATAASASDSAVGEVESSSENSSEPVLTTINIHNDDSARFSGAEWFNKMQEVGVSIIGLGGIGSWLALLLSRLKVRIMYCRDMDKVEAVNLAGQLYQSDDVGSNKTEAVRNLINRFNDRRKKYKIQ